MNTEVRNPKYQFQTSKNIFFTSDTHFGHQNILRFCGRPYETVEQMNQDLIARWNSVVGENDIIFHLGDLCFGGAELCDSIIPQLNGQKYWILGNHDYKNWKDRYQEYFVHVGPKMVISIDGQPILLNHEPLLCFGGQTNNKWWHLFGHVHTCKGDKQGADYERMKMCSTPTMYDVGVDFNNYTPVKFQTIKERIDEQVQQNTNYLIWK